MHVSIRQKIEHGLSLKGYGVLRINEVGTLYLEMICKEADGVPASDFYSAFPADPFDGTQKLYLEAKTLDGDSVYSEEFSIRIGVFDRSPPFMLRLLLHEVYVLDTDRRGESLDDYLYFELFEKSGIPANKMNTMSSTYGSESMSWDESEISLNGSKVSILNKKDRTVVRASGKFDSEELYKVLLFYIGMSSGVLPQPYCLIRNTSDSVSIHLKSTNKQLRNIKIPQPFPSATAGGGWPNCQYDILREMIRVKTDAPLHFDSSYSQWMRVWHAFNSEKNITILTLGVAIEGLLNDIFIPALKINATDEAFEKSKVDLIVKLKEIEAEDTHVDSLVKHVERWGNIHAGKALSMLVEKGMVLDDEKNAWGDLRNSAAHPKFKENTEARQEKEHKRISKCLTLFYRLILNIYSYDGPMYEFGKLRNADLVKREFVKILD
ncbi:hypothetical protein [Aquipseudomonas alcaligenes]|uniref:hypothetical protein n=1 Tax=Aquipseudomonas alcaligenes TaxID=43263 RepID=UPI0016590BCC|nr:hypothetical protein [Pseudomonas alcaligenes]